jgi:hypothetical protein
MGFPDRGNNAIGKAGIPALGVCGVFDASCCSCNGSVDGKDALSESLNHLFKPAHDFLSSSMPASAIEFRCAALDL